MQGDRNPHAYKGRDPFQDASVTRGLQNLTHFDVDLSTGVVDRIIAAPGDMVYIDQLSSGYAYLEFNSRQAGALSPVIASAGFAAEVDFASIKINAPAQLNKTIRVIVGNGAKLRSGANVFAQAMTISTVDGSLQRTESDRGFWRSAPQTAVAGQYPHGMLYNPAASTRNVYLEQISISSDTAGAHIGRRYNAALATVLGNGESKRLYGANSLAELHTDTNVAIIPAASNNVFNIRLLAGTPWTIKFSSPIMIPPGTGFVIVGPLAGSETANFEWYEQ